MKSKTKNMILAIAVSVVAIFLPAWLLDKWFEGIVFFFCHWFIREQFPKQYHHIIPAMCRLITSVTFFFGVSFILPFALSLISAIAINYFIGWVGFTKKQADTYELKYERLKAELEKNKEFDVDNCTREELISRCIELKFSAEDIDLAVKLFMRDSKQVEIARELCIEERSVQQKKRRLKQKLNKK
jgi:predicted membrane protein